MTYRDAITAAMTQLGNDSLVRFVGYGMKKNGAMGTLSGVDPSQIQEMPVAESLMAGVATGMALTGLRPVVYYERADFILNAADAIVNHTDKLELMSRGEFKCGVILRVTVGNKRKPLFTGETHTQDFSEAFSKMLRMPVYRLTEVGSIAPAYDHAYARLKEGQSTMLFEYKDNL